MDFGSPVLNSIGVSLLTIAVGALVTWFWQSKNAAVTRAKDIADAAVARAKEIAAEHDALKARTAILEESLRRIDSVVSPIYGVMQGLLVKELTHDNQPEMDRLLKASMEPVEMKTNDSDRLHHLLSERAEDESVTQHERDSAIMLPIVLKRARGETATQEVATEVLGAKMVQVVGLIGVTDPVVAEETKTVLSNGTISVENKS